MSGPRREVADLEAAAAKALEMGVLTCWSNAGLLNQPERKSQRVGPNRGPSSGLDWDSQTKRWDKSRNSGQTLCNSPSAVAKSSGLLELGAARLDPFSIETA